jgi:hypothetical protein
MLLFRVKWLVFAFMVEIKRNITPPALLACGLGPACPAAYELTDGSLLVIGKKVAADELPGDVRSRIADNEIAIVIPSELLKPQ